MIQNPYKQYQTQNVMTASSEELLIMLYNGCVRYIKQAVQATEQTDIPKAHLSMIRAQDIILEFMATLDVHSEVSKTLMPLYDYLYRRLVQANIEKDPEILKEVLRFISELRDTWVEAARLLRQKRVADG